MELSIEEKAKHYDEALEKSKRLYEQGTITESLCYVFPELKESEDEKIRDADKKELKEIKKKPKKCMYSKDDYTDEDRLVLCDGCDEICELKQKTAWSEDDERNLDWLITVCERIYYKSDPQVSPEGALVLREWLKFLKERYTWKPSDEQMKALNTINVTGNISYAGQGQKLINLYNELKKLREE